MKILITGASGFIGSFIVSEAINRGYETWAGIRATSSKKYLPFDTLQYIDFDYSNKEKLVELLNKQKSENGKWDVIVHNMGLTKNDDKDGFDRVNYRYTRNFIEALIEADMAPEQFVYMSSLSAFGPGNPDGKTEIKLSDTPQPNTLYGKSKLKTEEFLRSLNNFNYTILRPTGVYGPREKDYFVMLQTLSRHINPAIGFKPQYITFIYVKDLVNAIYLAIEKRAIGKAYFVADGDVWTSDQYAALAKKLLGVKLTVPLKVPCFLVKGLSYTLDTVCGWFGKTPTLNKDKYNILSVLNWKCETGPLKDDLGFKAEYPLERGLQECIDWYRKEGWL
ncbi:MAG: NAD(P)-dependent oxidoreductase [Paludibacteraceae bacterium]|nr:NAD(P)-dependent oxidoreductase [Paludibacteraceae bacterium]